ncbi:hypothetical protein SDJN03_26419, partial [Cucurbita argyrosperma subsp. sororia]
MPVEDSFSLSDFPFSSEHFNYNPPNYAATSPVAIRKHQAIRHFSVKKIVDGRLVARGSMASLLKCYMYRASAYRSAGRIAEVDADCNRTLALNPSCIQAFRDSSCAVRIDSMLTVIVWHTIWNI